MAATSNLPFHMRKDLLDLAVDFGWLAEKTARYSAMTAYQHVGVASDFSPTFSAVLAEAKRFSSHCGADLEIVHAGAFDSEKERRFFEALGQRAQIRWIRGETIARAIIAAVENFAYELLIAGTLHRGGGRYVAIVCGTDVFHHSADRWPDAVDVGLLGRYARAFANGALQLAGRGA